MFCPAKAAPQNVYKIVKKIMLDDESRMTRSFLIIAYF